MGRALARGWLAAEAIEAEIVVVDPNPEARSAAEASGLAALSAAEMVEDDVDVAVLAVKPADVDAVLAKLSKAHLVISIAAGKTIGEMESVVGNDVPIVRAMPNTPAAIGHGVTGLCANSRVSAAEQETAGRLMRAVGTVEWLDDESQMDAVTAVSGSGPAYVFLLIEALTQAGVDQGLESPVARRLAAATVAGAGAYAAESELEAALLRQQVTSPNGTTAAALAVLLEGDGLKSLVRRAVEAAAKRSRELGSAAARKAGT